MRQFIAVVVLGLAGSMVSAGDAIKVEVKGPHICCPQCVKVAGKILEKVDGVSEASASVKTKTVSFNAKDEKAAKAGVTALFNGGFYGKATADGKALKVSIPAVKKGEKVGKISVKDVHVCCGACKKAIAKLFADAKVSYEGEGAQRTVILEEDGLERSAVIQALRKAGFNGTIGD